MARELLTQTAPLTHVSIGTLTKVTSAFSSAGKTSVNRDGNCGRQRKSDKRDARALVLPVRKNRGATLLQVTDIVSARRGWTVSARRVCRQLPREGNIKVAVHKPLVTKTHAHLRDQWGKNHQHWSTEMGEKVIWLDESSSTTLSPSGQVNEWQSARERGTGRSSQCPLKGALSSCGGYFAGMVWVRLSPQKVKINTELF